MPPDPDPAAVLADRLRRLSDQADRANAAAAAVGRALRTAPAAAGGWRFALDGDSPTAALAVVGTRLVLADVAGYGGPAGLLVGLFARDAATAADGPPGEWLAAANRAVLGLGLPEPAFVSMLAAEFGDGGRVAFARAAAPPPAYRPAAGPPAEWAVPGPLVGVFAADYPTRTETLNGGDAVAFTVGGLTVTVRRDAERSG
jgi:hypothetical protein